MNRPLHRTAALAAALLIVLAGCGDDDDDTAAQDPTPTPVATTASSPSAGASSSADPSSSASASPDAEDGRTIEINLVQGKPSEKVGPTVTVARGDELTLVITSDEAHEIHVHGLDEYIKIAEGETVTKTFTIDLAPGSYEVEVHENEVVLFNLQVK